VTGAAFAPTCPLCQTDGGSLIVRTGVCRVIRADEPGFPAFYRVVLTDHVAEWSDVSEPDQLSVMRVVSTVERVLREVLSPTKINLAALGNAVPHVHWHVIARFDWDSHFPAPIWAQPQRATEPDRLLALAPLMPRVDDWLRQRLLPR
jgi:diadenosine tetraphosphate (Ap4A) HIT family hydrolase